MDGAAIVKNAPCVTTLENPEEIVRTIGQHICGGSLSHGSLYGDTFHVISVENANNVAFTSVSLDPHQDLAYYESKPGFQLLHCAARSSHCRGGESILVDCMAAAHRFRQLAPDLFEILVKTPATFVKSRHGAKMSYTRPHIVLNIDGYGTDLNDMNREIVAVHWAPAFAGPLQIHPDRVEDYFRAHAAFELMLDNTKCPKACSEGHGIDLDLAMTLSKYGKDYTWEYLLKPGETVVFNNTRMLHGRRSFEIVGRDKDTNGDAGDNKNSDRHLIGAYTNIDDTLNNYRMLLERYEPFQKRTIPNVGNGTPSVLPAV